MWQKNTLVSACNMTELVSARRTLPKKINKKNKGLLSNKNHLKSESQIWSWPLFTSGRSHLDVRLCPPTVRACRCQSQPFPCLFFRLVVPVLQLYLPRYSISAVWLLFAFPSRRRAAALIALCAKKEPVSRGIVSSCCLVSIWKWLTCLSPGTK